MVELEFYDPSGRLEITHQHAARLPTLNGKRIGILSGEQWQAHRTLPMLKSIIEADFPTPKSCRSTPSRRASMPSGRTTRSARSRRAVSTA